MQANLLYPIYHLSKTALPHFCQSETPHCKIVRRLVYINFNIHTHLFLISMQTSSFRFKARLTFTLYTYLQLFSHSVQFLNILQIMIGWAECFLIEKQVFRKRTFINLNLKICYDLSKSTHLLIFLLT